MLWLQVLGAVLLLSGTGLLLGFLRSLDLQADEPAAPAPAVVTRRPAPPAEARPDWLHKAA